MTKALRNRPTRREAELKAANDHLLARIDGMRRRCDDERAAMQARLDRALHAVARLRTENAELSVLLDNASNRLFQAMGYNPAGLARLGVPLDDEPVGEPGEVAS